MKLRSLLRTGLVGLALVSAMGAANAFARLPEVAIERAMNGQLITIRFSHTNARMIELKVNGVSVGTRAVNGTSTGSTEFRLDPATFDEGKNTVEAFVYDQQGNLIAVETTKMDVEAITDSPVEISTPKIGSTVQGLVEIRLNLKKRFGKVMASFMIDGEWKAIRNYEPYAYVLDTEALSNGWHEVQAWVVDENNVTWKSRKHRIFVNNPGGRTERISAPVAAPTMAKTAPAVAPVTANLVNNTISAPISKAGTVKPMFVKSPAPTVTGARMLTPTGKRVMTPKVAKVPVKVVAPKTASVKAVTVKPNALPSVATKAIQPKVAPVKVVKAPVAPAKATPVANITAATSTVRLQAGRKINFNGNLNLSYEGKKINFDVQPRVEQGVALSPFRHLYEAQGGKVKWNNRSKSLNAKGGFSEVSLSVGKQTARVSGNTYTLEMIPHIVRGRTIVPLSFMSDVLNVNIDVDTKTGHVLITKKK